MLEIIHPLTGEKLQVANNDFKQSENWCKALEACEKLGSGWRLPSIEELQVMYEVLHKKGKGNFKEDNRYWSSSEYSAASAWLIYFGFGATDYSFKYYSYYVRAVRAF
jgi:hypothetical protein